MFSSNAVAAVPSSEYRRAAPPTCTHCGLLVPAGLVVDAAAEQFCCSGCRVVFEAIRSHGLERYYRLKEANPGTATQARPTGRAFAELDDREFLDSHAPSIAPGVRCTELYLEGLHCSACVWLVEKLPRVAPGVIESRLDLRRALVRIVWDEREAQLSRIARTLDSLGYTPHAGRDATAREVRKREDRNLLVRIAIAGAGAGNVMLLAFALYGGTFSGMQQEYSSLFRWTSLAISLVVLLWPGSLFFRGAWAALRTRTAHLDLPIALGLGAGMVAGTVNTLLGRGEIYFDSLTSLVFLLLVGRFVQRRLERRAADAVELLFSLTPSFARLREGSEVREVPIEALQIGQIVEVRPGESFPADGAVVDGESTVDLSLLTGESQPISIGPTEEVFAGALNVQRPLLVQIAATGRETRVGKLFSLVEQCAQRKAPIVRLADRMAGYFTVAALALFVVTLVGWWLVDARRAVDNAVSLLIVSCPCGLGLATPFAAAVALGRAARSSILIKGGDVLEKLAQQGPKAGTVFLDKTGTLTESGLAVIEWHGDTSIRDQVAALESQISHPIARALAANADDWDRRGAACRAPIQSFPQGIRGQIGGRHYVVGSESFVCPESTPYDAQRQGEASLAPTTAGEHPTPAPQWAIDARRKITEKCLTPVWVSVDGRVAAVIGVGGLVRDDATNTIQEIRRLGLHAVILSGDDPDTVAALGSELGIPAEACKGGLSPEEKLRIVESAACEAPAFMVGDGVNDAAALSAATVGIAVHGGAEASLAAADVYMTRPGVAVVVELLEGSRRTLGVIRRCLRVSLGYNAFAASLAMAGVVSPLIAAILMPIASFTVLGIALWTPTFPLPKARAECQ